jgi:tRNA dimethylallyltransferase
VSCGSALEHQEIYKILNQISFPKEQKTRLPRKQKRQKVLVIAGPTGCGKTQLSLLLAKALQGEVISADSMQVYKGMDIGTAKATLQQRQAVPHHLIDIRDINEPFNVVDFYYEARHACSKVLSRGQIPIIVGGAGFYLRTLLYGPPSGPPSIASVRNSLEKEMENKGADVMYERLTSLDPEYARTITMHDKQKIVRGLEIIQLTNERVSQQKWKFEGPPRDYDFLCWFIFRPREVLYERIEKRCEEMLADGLINEAQDLQEKGLIENLSAKNSIGYRQVLQFLETQQTEEDYQQLLKDFKTASRHYAKRQFTWFRKEPLFRWLNVELHDIETAADMIIQDFKARL